MKNMNYTKKTYIALFVLIAGGLIALSINDSSFVLAKSRGGGGSHHHGGGRPPGGHKDSNHYAQDSKSGHCKKVHGYCVTFSKGGCGNFYIKGYHYGGSKACQLLGRCGSHHGGGGNGNGNVSSVNFSGTSRTGVSRTATSSTGTAINTVTSVLTRSCTPGATGANACPADSLGSVILSFNLNPSYANSKTNTCPLFWVPGKETPTAKIICSIESNGVETDVPTDPKKEGYPNGFPVPPGKHTLTCTRMLVTTVTDASGSHDEEVDTNQSAQVNCRAYPQIREI
jgi:hypothetical protein